MQLHKNIRIKEGPLGLGVTFNIMDEGYCMRCPYCGKPLLAEDAAFNFMYELLSRTVLNPHSLWVDNQTARLFSFNCIHCKQKVYVLTTVMGHEIIVDGEPIIGFESDHTLLTSDEVKIALRGSNIELDDLEVDEVDIKQFINS